MKRAIFSIIAAIAVLSGTIGFCNYSQAKPEGKASSPSGSLYAKFENELLSVDIKDAPLDEVLQKLSD
jgi:hypothetical protein